MLRVKIHYVSLPKILNPSTATTNPKYATAQRTHVLEDACTKSMFIGSLYWVARIRGKFLTRKDVLNIFPNYFRSNHFLFPSIRISVVGFHLTSAITLINVCRTNPSNKTIFSEHTQNLARQFFLRKRFHHHTTRFFYRLFALRWLWG